MFNWFNKSTDNSRRQSTNGNISNSNVNFGDTVTNIINIPKKILLLVALLLVILTAAVFLWRGSFFVHFIQNNQNVIGNTVGGNLTINYSSPEEIAKIVATLTAKHQQDSQAKDEQIKALTAAVTALSQGKGVIGTESQINAALAALAQGNTEQAKALFKQETEKGEQAAKQSAEAYRNLGALAFLDNTQEALTAYKRATELDPDNTDGWNKLGHLYLRTGELDQAIAAYQTVLKLGQSHNDQQEIAAAYGNLGEVYRIRGDLDKAIEMYNKVLAIDEPMGNKESMANAYGNLGLVYDIRGDLDKAVDMFQKILKIHEELGDKEGLAKDYGNLGLVYDTRGELNKAIEMYNQALNLNQTLGRKEGMAINYGNLGLVYATRGELDKAVEMHNKALAINQELGRKEGMAINYGNLGNVYYTRGDFDKAIEMYNKALVIAEELDLKEIKTNNYANLGIVYKQKGNKAEAKRYWQKAIELYKYIGSPKWKNVQKALDDLK